MSGDLPRRIGFWGGSAIMVGIIIGSGIFQTPPSIAQEMGSPAVAYTMYVLAMIASGQGDYPLAQARFEKCLQTSRKVRNDWLTAWALHGPMPVPPPEGATCLDRD